MSAKHVRTAADLVRFGCSLCVDCMACGATRTLSGAEVYQVHGKAPLDLLARRLKCRRCRLKVAKIAVLPPV